MMFSLYESIQALIFLLARLLLPFVKNPRFQRFIRSREGSLFFDAVVAAREKLQDGSGAKPRPQPCIWVHVASVGELEQAIPPLRELVTSLQARVFLTYFSVSTEPFIKNVPGLLAAAPFPLDFRNNHRFLISTLGVSHLFLVRYDLWPALLFTARSLGVHTHLLAATYRSARRDPIPWIWNRFRRAMLAQFETIFAVNEEDVRHFSQLAIPSTIVLAGDPKWARARHRAQTLAQAGLSKELRKITDELPQARANRKVLVLGSPHAEEHDLMVEVLAHRHRSLLLFYVPHDIAPQKVEKLQAQLTKLNHPTVTMSQLLSDESTIGIQLASSTVILFDRMGFLAELYSIADLAIVGGGFDGQIHNTLEPVAHPVATIFGANVRRAPEAQVLIEENAALGFLNPKDMVYFLMEYLEPVVPRPNASRPDPNQQTLQCLDAARRLFSKIPDTSELVCARIGEYRKTI
jgi:3-deoxy-D-manno-octulosonic-acid transferase